MRTLARITLLISVSFALLGMAVGQQPVVRIPASLPNVGLHHYNVYESSPPYYLRDTLGTELTWDLTKLELSDPLLQTDSLMPWSDASDDSIPDGTAMVLARAFGYTRYYLNVIDGELFELGRYAPYYNEYTRYLYPLKLWSDGSGYGSFSERYSPMQEDLMVRREVVGSGTLISTFGRFPDLLLLKVWQDRDASYEHYELVDPENVLRPIGLFWYNGDVQLFEPVGYESWSK